MSAIRGAEVTIRFVVDNVLQGGTWVKATEFTLTPRSDLNEEDYLGEPESDIDFQHHGFDFSFSVHEHDESLVDFLNLIIDREQNHLPHPKIVMTVFRRYRDADANNRVQAFRNVFLKVNEMGFSGRKDKVTASLEGKCKRASRIAA